MNLGNVSWATLQMGGDKCLQLNSRDFLNPITRHPLPSLRELEFELQTSPANLFLSHNVYFLPPGTPQLLFSAPPRTVNGESQPCPSHPSKAINGDGNHTTQRSLLAGFLEHGSPHTKNPHGSVTEGHFGSQGVKLTLLWRNVPHLDVTKAWAKRPIFGTTFGGKLQRRFTVFETIKSSLTFHFFCIWIRKPAVFKGSRNGRTVRWYILYSIKKKSNRSCHLLTLQCNFEIYFSSVICWNVKYLLSVWMKNVWWHLNP